MVLQPVMAEVISEINTAHNGSICDCQLDYYGKKLATTSADHSIKLWEFISTRRNNDINDHGQTQYHPVLLAELKAHEGPVWQVAWAHPKFGSIIASCSYDRRVIIWREVATNDWRIDYKDEGFSGSVNCVGWAPWEFGLELACGSSDGRLTILSYRHTNNSWNKSSFHGHLNGVNALSWAPSGYGEDSDYFNDMIGPRGNVDTINCAVKRFVSGGADNQLRIWRQEDSTGQWVESYRLFGGHTDWVRDVAWRPSVGSSCAYIASCSEDQTVIFWRQERPNSTWERWQTISIGSSVWRLSWSTTGNILAVASGGNNVTIFQENLSGIFESITSLEPTIKPTPEGRNSNIGNSSSDAAKNNVSAVQIASNSNGETIGHNDYHDCAIHTCAPQDFGSSRTDFNPKLDSYGLHSRPPTASQDVPIVPTNSPLMSISSNTFAHVSNIPQRNIAPTTASMSKKVSSTLGLTSVHQSSIHEYSKPTTISESISSSSYTGVVSTAGLSYIKALPNNHHLVNNQLTCATGSCLTLQNGQLEPNRLSTGLLSGNIISNNTT